MTIFKLKVSQYEQCCNFELSWGKGERISAQLNYPKSLETSYTNWRQAYLNCYENLRGKVVKTGKIKAPPQDWFGKLREAEADFLSKFHSWLRLYDWYVELPKNNCSETCPFPYVLALSHSLVNKNRNTNDLPQPQLSKSDFRESVILERDKEKEIDFLQKLRFSRINYFLQWFQPIIDYSIPPQQADQTISACELLGSCTPTPGIVRENLKSKIVIVAAGGYEQAGVDEEGEDNDFIPLPIAFWRHEINEKGWDDWLNGKRSFTGGEAHAYTTHHLLNQHLVIPIPNFFMVLIAAVLGKFIVKILQHNPGRMGWELIFFGISSVVYVFVSLQVYVSFELLVPIVFPLVVLYNYVR